MRYLTIALVAAVSFGCSEARNPTGPSPVQPDSTDVVLPDQADHGGRALKAVLTGSEVVPGPGDPDGSGALVMTANSGQREFCYSLRTDGIDTVTAAHLHRGEAGVNGEGVFTLLLPLDGYSSGCVDDLDRGLIHDVLAHPAMYHVTLHTVAFPDGALRGQFAFERRVYQ